MIAEQTGITEQLNQVVAILQQTASDEQIIQVVEPNETLQKAGRVQGNQLAVRSGDLAGQWDVYAVGISKTRQSPEEAMALFEYFKIFRGDPEVGPRLKALEFAKLIGEMRFRRPMLNLFKTDEEIDQEQRAQAMKAIQAQMEMAGGAGGGLPAGAGMPTGDPVPRLPMANAPIANGSVGGGLPPGAQG